MVTIHKPAWLQEHDLEGDVLFGLVSDTHIPEARTTIFDELYEAFRGVDVILHAGDIHDVIVLDWLEEVAPVIARLRGHPARVELRHAPQSASLPPTGSSSSPRAALPVHRFPRMRCAHAPT